MSGSRAGRKKPEPFESSDVEQSPARVWLPHDPELTVSDDLCVKRYAARARGGIGGVVLEQHRKQHRGKQRSRLGRTRTQKKRVRDGLAFKAKEDERNQAFAAAGAASGAGLAAGAGAVLP